MKTRELLPFDRNRYYKGKMLTSSDFEAEQLYMNNKRRFLNQNVLGSGVLCGLGVTSLDDLSIMIESGAALDPLGRELVLENSVVKKLSTIDGFEEVSSNDVMLCIRYAENLSQPVYAINQKEGGEEYENNRIEEGVEFFLMDADACMEQMALESEFFAGGVLFEDDDYQVSLRIPTYLCADTFVKISLVINKKTASSAVLNFEAVLSSPALTSTGKDKDITISAENLNLTYGSSKTVSCWAAVTKEAIGDTTLMLKAGCGYARVNNAEYALSPFNTRMNVVDDDPDELAARECGKVNLEFRAISAMTDYVKLARISMVRTEAAYLIESVTENSIKEYVRTTRDAVLRDEFAGYFISKLPMGMTGNISAASDASAVSPAMAPKSNMKFETGIVEVALGGKARRGDICYSGEIMHGFGKGEVFVEIGFDSLEFDQKINKDTRTVVYGNPSLFEGQSAPNVETAVKVFSDKGSFMVAVKLLEDVEQLVLTFRYVAYRCGEDEPVDEMDAINDKSISAITPTVVLGSKESYFFQVQFNNMKATSVSYELTEPASGEITADGVYTAPVREGVYEIRIYCTDRPLICTYAYAIVKKKTSNNDEGVDSNEAPVNVENAVDSIKDGKVEDVMGNILS